MTRQIVPDGLGEVNGEIPISVSEGVGVVVERHLEPGTLEPGNRASHVGHLEDRLESRDHPRPGHEL